MPKCTYPSEGKLCGRDTVALSQFCSIHAEQGVPESVVSPLPGRWESGQVAGNVDSPHRSPANDDDVPIT